MCWIIVGQLLGRRVGPPFASNWVETGHGNLFPRVSTRQRVELTPSNGVDHVISSHTSRNDYQCEDANCDGGMAKRITEYQPSAPQGKRDNEKPLEALRPRGHPLASKQGHAVLVTHTACVRNGVVHRPAATEGLVQNGLRPKLGGERTSLHIAQF